LKTGSVTAMRVLMDPSTPAEERKRDEGNDQSSLSLALLSRRKKRSLTHHKLRLRSNQLRFRRPPRNSQNRRGLRSRVVLGSVDELLSSLSVDVCRIREKISEELEIYREREKRKGKTYDQDCTPTSSNLPLDPKPRTRPFPH